MNVSTTATATSRMDYSPRVISQPTPMNVSGTEFGANFDQTTSGTIATSAASTAPNGTTSVSDQSTAATSAINTFADLLQNPFATVASGVQSPTASSPSTTPPTVEDLFKQSDADGNGVLSKDEFQKFDAAMHPNGHLTEAATGIAVDGNYMFSIINHGNNQGLNLAQVEQYGYLVPEATLPADASAAAS